MISTADALEVMTLVSACHRRTAPRLDDKQATLATATLWAELFNLDNFDLPDLVVAVKQRACTCADAPEPADIIAVARELRSERRHREQVARDRVEIRETIQRRTRIKVEHRRSWLRYAAAQARQAGDEAWAGELLTILGVLDVYGNDYLDRRRGSHWFSDVVKRDEQKAASPRAITA